MKEDIQNYLFGVIESNRNLNKYMYLCVARMDVVQINKTKNVFLE